MEARVQQSAHWRIDTPESQSNVSYLGYIRNLPVNHIKGRASIVLSGVSIGMTIGAAAGAPAAGLGAAPGAGIGAGVGFVIGVMACAAIDGTNYNKLRNSLSSKALEDLDECFSDCGFTEDDKCAIGGHIPAFPVRINGHHQVYERAEIEAWQKKNGTNPITRQPFSLEDIRVCRKAIAKTGIICDLILNDPVKRATLTPVQLKGFAILRETSLKATELVRETTVKHLVSDNKNKKISTRDMAREMMILADIIEPLIGDEANAARFEVDVSKIVIPDSALAKNQPKAMPQDEMKV